MSDIEEALQSRLANYVGLTALVSTRIYALKLPQNVAYPAVSHSRIATVTEPLMVADAGVVAARWQVSSWGSTMASAALVRDQVRAATKRWRGTVLGVVIQDTYLLDEQAIWDEAGEVYHLPLDVQIHYEG